MKDFYKQLEFGTTNSLRTNFGTLLVLHMLIIKEMLLKYALIFIFIKQTICT